MEYRSSQLILPFEPGIVGSAADLGPENVADDDAESAATIGEAAGASAPVRADRC